MAGGRERARFWAVLALLVLGAAAAYRLLLGAEPAAPRAASAPPEPVRLAVSALSGEVTLVRAGKRSPLSLRDELRPDDAIETAPGGRVELAGGSYDVALEESGRFDVQEITTELSRFRLGSGLVSARIDDDPRRAVEIGTAMGPLARATGGDIAMSRAGDVVAIGVRRGQAEFRAGGSTVVVREGEQSTSARGRAPSRPAALPPSLLLKVAWPEAHTTNERRITVTGHTVPGAVVVLGNERVDVGADGRFTHVIVLREGRQKLSARAHGVAGSASSDGPAVVLDTRAPDARFDTRGLWVAPRP